MTPETAQAAVSLRDLSAAAGAEGRDATDLIDDIDSESDEVDALARMMNAVLEFGCDSGFDETSKGLAVVAKIIRTKTKANAARAKRLWQFARAGLTVAAAVAEEVPAQRRH